MQTPSLSRLLAALAIVAGVAAAQDQPPAVYTIDPAASTITIEVGKAGMFGFAGHTHEVATRRVTGEVRLGHGDLAGSAVSLEIDAASLRVTGKGDPPGDVPEVQRVMLGDRVLDVGRFPSISFRSRAVSKGRGATGAAMRLKIEGDLTLHGVTRPVTITPDVTLGPEVVTARGEFSIKQTDFGIQPVTAGGGTVRVRDAVDIVFVIQARETERTNQ